MSTILKALRRLEEDRSSSGARPLREEVASAPRESGSPPRRRALSVSVALAVALLAAGVAGYRLWPGTSDAARTDDVAARPTPPPEVAVRAERERPPAVPTRIPAPPRTTPAPAPLRDDVAAESAGGLPEEAFASGVAVVERPPAAPRVPIEVARASDPLPAPGISAREAAPAPPAPVTSAPQAAPAPPIARSRPEPAVTVARSSPEPAVTVARSLPEPAVTVARSSPEPAVTVARSLSEPAPTGVRSPGPAPAPPRAASEPEIAPARAVRESPASDKIAKAPAAVSVEAPTPAPETAASAEPSEAAPALHVEKTLWHPRPERRVAFVKVGDAPAKPLHEGDVAGRMLVSEIQPSGVIFLDDGRSVQRKIGE